MGAEAVFIVSELCVHAHGADKRDEKTGAPQTLVFRGIGKARRQARGRVIPITFAFSLGPKSTLSSEWHP
jgi:hypothetical protein